MQEQKKPNMTPTEMEKISGNSDVTGGGVIEPQGSKAVGLAPP